MPKPQCQLTTRDFTVLETLLRKKTDRAFLRLLRLKLSTATFVTADDVAPDVAAIGSRVDFTIDDLLIDSPNYWAGKGGAIPPVPPDYNDPGAGFTRSENGEHDRKSKSPAGGTREASAAKGLPPGGQS